MSATITLGRRALREAIRQPDALFMTMFIPLFFLVVNTGQAAQIFPSDSTDFLEGQGYGAFQLPITLLLAASFGMAALEAFSMNSALKALLTHTAEKPLL